MRVAISISQMCLLYFRMCHFGKSKPQLNNSTSRDIHVFIVTHTFAYFIFRTTRPLRCRDNCDDNVWDDMADGSPLPPLSFESF